ncbi:LysR family transcriptional regulator [Marinobacter nauticus]|uniref:LysR family transcriptional regulator n=1 Tax=Marinobacter nauticus TaxID=2743 RepID=UPI001C946323|nr:LysR family transcriptional regulator [Marinobacter nauticus]MBY5938709.1 LysR family transcriptional regulator [Marinobacter nauticus]MBY5955938.1 LysR family transcriptional regulator [Marinobacter nauticus]MBY5963382.1 LysR family transcriptional regulator [Marinobacter nauticus]MBY6009729.1 LysR family transcriptional regulator [Marinobacter nauticus]MBY6101421.1 LysR family transcriptional regulator [Marinobacter nauticus]
MVERHHLEIMRAVERQGSLTAAAEQLHLTQSALSHAIRKLEQQLGTSVWLREGRQLRLTQAGHQLLALANRLLPQFEHAEMQIHQIAQGQRGSLRVGMECHPCYQWLLKVVGPYLQQWPDVDVDVKQEFQFGGMGALFGHDIDLLVTPDPLHKPGVRFEPVFDYEQVLVVSEDHSLADEKWVEPHKLEKETLITYPVAVERLDIFTRFFLPAHTAPARHKTIETTDIMLQMVAAGRGVSALPRWLVDDYARNMPIRALKLGQQGMPKQIFLGFRERDEAVDYLNAFVKLARSIRWN